MHQTTGSAFAIPSDASVVDVDPKGARARIASADGATVSLVDTATGDELARRTFEGCRWPPVPRRRCGASWSSTSVPPAPVSAACASVRASSP